MTCAGDHRDCTAAARKNFVLCLSIFFMMYMTKYELSYQRLGRNREAIGVDRNGIEVSMLVDGQSEDGSLSIVTS